MGLKRYLESIEHHFEPGGKHEKFYALYEAVATIFYTPGWSHEVIPISVIPSILNVS